MMTTIINWLATNWLAITILLGFLAWIAKKTDWAWDDKVIEYIKEILNLIFPGKKLYTIEEIESKGVAKIVEEERGRYMPGAEGEAGIGIRFEGSFAGDEQANWGYYDGKQGFGFGADHRFSPSEQTSISDPNLPITAEVSNGIVTNDIVMYVGGRQYSVYVNFQPSKRTNSERVLTKTIGDTLTPIISFKRKSDYESVASKIAGLDILTDSELLYQFRVNGTLTGAVFGTPTDVSASETAMESDVTATAISGGELLEQGLVDASGFRFQISGNQSIRSLGIEIPALQPVTLCARAVTGTATVSAIARWSEEW